MKFIYLLLLTVLLYSCNCFTNREKSKLSIDVTEKILTKDSILTDSSTCTSLIITKYKNGQIKEKGCQGFYEGKGTPVGTHYNYDSLGNLVKTIYFHPDEFGKDYKIIKWYNKKGEIISETIYNNDELYEVEEKIINKIP